MNIDNCNHINAEKIKKKHLLIYYNNRKLTTNPFRTDWLFPI